MGDFAEDSNQVPEAEADKLLIQSSATSSSNPTSPIGEFRYNEDGDEAAFYLRIIPFVVSKSPTQTTIPSQLMPLLRLLSACYDPRYGGDGLGEIDAVIGCPIFTSSEAQLGSEYESLPEEVSEE